MYVCTYTCVSTCTREWHARACMISRTLMTRRTSTETAIRGGGEKERVSERQEHPRGRSFLEFLGGTERLDEFVLPPRVSCPTGGGGSFGRGAPNEARPNTGGGSFGRGAPNEARPNTGGGSFGRGAPNEARGSGNVLGRGNRVRDLAHEEGDSSPMASRLALPTNDSASWNAEGLVLLPRRHLREQEPLPAAAGGLPPRGSSRSLCPPPRAGSEQPEQEPLPAAAGGLPPRDRSPVRDELDLETPPPRVAAQQGFFILTFFFCGSCG
jgi:hypothetical protein